MTRTVILHIGGNRYDPLPNDHHTVKIWEELAREADEYHVFARNRRFSFNSSRVGKIHLHLIPSVSDRMFEFLLTHWLVLYQIRHLRPTYIVAQCPVMGGLPAALASLIMHIPLLVELHGTHYFQPARKGLAGRIEHLLYRTLSVFAFRRASRIRSLSKDMTAELKCVYGVSIANKAVVVPTRVNMDIFKNTRSTYSLSGALKIISVGGLFENKNHAALIKVLAKSNIDYVLTIVGEGPEEVKLLNLIDQLGISDQVRLTGKLDHVSLARELTAHDVYVHYSKAEGLSRAILEAMACGCPIITTRVGFIDGVLEDHHNSFVIDQPWDENLIPVLNEIIFSESLRQTIGKAGEETIQSSYEAKKVFHEYRKLIKSL